MKIGIAEILLVVFIILKLCNVIDWSWWWVLSPLWIVVILAVAIGIAKIRIEKRKERELAKEVWEQQILHGINPEQRAHITNINVELKGEKHGSERNKS